MMRHPPCPLLVFSECFSPVVALTLLRAARARNSERKAVRDPAIRSAAAADRHRFARAPQRSRWAGRPSLSPELVPSEGAALLIALLVMLAVAFDWNRPRHPRNIELLALLPIGFLFFE